MRPAFMLAVLSAALAVGRPEAGAETEPGLVEITVTAQEFDQFFPWQRRSPGTRRGYGVVVDGGRVLTTESLVRNHELVELRRPRSGEKIRADVLLADCQCNLALLEAPAAAALEGLPPAALAEHLAPSNRVTILQFDDTSEIQRGDGHVVQLRVAGLPRAPYSVLSATLLTDLNVNGEGAAVLADGKLAGLMISYNWNTRTGEMLPYKPLGRFLQDAAAPPYEGVASAGFIWSQLVNPAKRAYLGVGERAGGILLLSCLPGTGAAETLQANDVLTEWDGYALDQLGYYEDPEFGRLTVAHLIMGHRKPGETVPVAVVRGGQPTNVLVRLQRYEERLALVPENTVGERPGYLVAGGFVIRELDAKYLLAHGKDWQREVDARLVHAYLTRKHWPSRPGEKIVMLSGVLPDPINVGYERFREEAVTHVNGQPVLNLDDVLGIVDRDGSLRRLTLKGYGVDLVLDQAELAAANERLAKVYRIPALRHPPRGARTK